MKACSGGEQQRLKFALALVPDPDLVILDEPTTGMDVGARQQFWDTMRADAADGRTIVFATHYLAEADAFADRTVLMARGRDHGRRPDHEVRAAYGGHTVTFRPPARASSGARRHRPGAGSTTVRTARSLRWASHDLEIASASLEAAFLALTATGTTPRRAATDRGSTAMTTMTTTGPTPDGHPSRRTTATFAYAGLDMRADQLRDRMGMFFTVALPAFLYFIFGATATPRTLRQRQRRDVRHGHHGGLRRGHRDHEHRRRRGTRATQGWGRQLGADAAAVAGLRGDQDRSWRCRRGRPDRADLRDRRGHRLVAATRSTGWPAPPSCGSARRSSRSTAWRSCLVFKGENAAGIASGLIVIMSFLGNLFTPMDGIILEIGRFTPLYGYAGLARYPISEGYLPDDAGHDPVWLLIANVCAWTVIFAARGGLGAAPTPGAGVTASPSRQPALAALPLGAVGLGGRRRLAGLPHLPGDRDLRGRRSAPVKGLVLALLAAFAVDLPARRGGVWRGHGLKIWCAMLLLAAGDGAGHRRRGRRAHAVPRVRSPR